MSFVMTTAALASSSASAASASASYGGTGGWGRIGFAAPASVSDDVAKNPTSTNGAVSSVSLSTGSYTRRRQFYGGGGATVVSDIDEYDDDDTESDDDDDDDDSSLEDLQPRGGSSTVMGIQAWPGRRSLYDDFAGAEDDDKEGDDEEDEGIERLTASHMLLSTVFRHGDGGGGGSNSNSGVVRVVSNDEDDDNVEEDGDGDDDAALAEKWEKQLRQNYQKEQQWQRLLAAMGDSTNGNGKVLDLSTIVEEEDDDDGSTADHLEEHEPRARSSFEDDNEDMPVFDDQVLCRREDDDVRRSNKVEAAIRAEKSSARGTASQRDDGIGDGGGVDHRIENPTTAVACARGRDAGGHQDGNREPLWLQLPGILPRVHTRYDMHDMHDLTTQCGVDVGEAVERGAPPHVELLQKTLECIAALAFCG
jgi:hypothetical protein